MDAMRSILDFGCGSGRVIRYWSKLSAAVHGTDYNPELVRWCQRHLPFATFQVNQTMPPLGYPNDTFDLVYALSVFTHLDEVGQLSWIRELRRIARPGGYVLITTHGPAPCYLRSLSPAQQARFHDGQLVINEGGPVGSNPFGAYHPESYVRGTLSEGFAVVAYLEGERSETPIRISTCSGNCRRSRWLAAERNADAHAGLTRPRRGHAVSGARHDKERQGRRRPAG
jgi:SAM-dependent methyltransferase